MPVKVSMMMKEEHHFHSDVLGLCITTDASLPGQSIPTNSN